MPSHTTPSEAEVVRTLSDLKLSTKVPQKPQAKPKSKPVADSWDDELSSGSDTETESLSKTTTKDSLSPLSPISTNPSDSTPNPPPPTPASPTPFEFPDNVASFGMRERGGSRGSSGSNTPDRRPEKTTAVAGRLIAGALGVRAPRRTDEEREFDKAMREQVRKKREEDRDSKKREAAEAEARKRAVWED